MSQERKMTGMATTSSGGKDFEPDPILEEDTQVDARLLGYCKIGTQEKDVWGKDGKKTGAVKEEKQAVMVFEIVDKDTYVDHGTEEEPNMVPRLAMKFVKDSSHEKSNQYSIAKALNKDSAWVDKDSKQGVVEPTMLLDCPIMLTMGVNKEGDRNNIKDFSVYPAKFRDSVEESVGTKFMFCPDNGAFCDTDISDVPNWLLVKITEDALEQGDFALIDEIEDQIDKNKEAAESKKDDKVKLEGDDKPATKSKPKPKSKTKAKTKADPDPDDQDAEEEEEEKVEDKSKATTSSRRRRRSSSKDLSSLTLEQLEDHLVKAGVEETVLDDLADNNDEDDAYKAALLKLAKSL